MRLLQFKDARDGAAYARVGDDKSPSTSCGIRECAGARP